MFGGEQAALGRIGDADRSLVKLARRDALATGIGDGLGLAVTGVTVAGVLAVAIGASASGQLDRVLIAMLALLALASFEAVTPLGAAARELSATLAAGRRLLELTDRSAAVRIRRSPHRLRAGRSRSSLKTSVRTTRASCAPHWTESASGSSPASGSRCSGQAAPARRQSPTCCCGSSIRSRDG